MWSIVPLSINLHPRDVLLVAEGQLMTVAVSAAVGFAIITWDYFMLLPNEIALYFNKKIWSIPPTWFFVVLRYSGILATFPMLFFTSIRNQHCQAAVTASIVGTILVVASSGAIFCYRVFVMWNGVRAVHFGLGVMYLIMIGCWIAVTSRYKTTAGSRISFLTNCQQRPIVPWENISYGSSAVFDVLVLALTAGKYQATLATNSKVGKQLYRQNMAYFLFTTVVNFAAFSFQALGPDYASLKPAVLPFFIFVTVTMGSRVYLNLVVVNQRQNINTVSRGIPLPQGRDNSQFTVCPSSGRAITTVDVKEPYGASQSHDGEVIPYEV